MKYIPILLFTSELIIFDIISIEKSNAEAEGRRNDEEGKQSGENDTVKETEVSPEPEKKKHIKKFYRQSIFPARTLESESDIREYLETIEKNLMTLLGDCDGIEIN